jgi:hypothetical protein
MDLHKPSTATKKRTKICREQRKIVQRLCGDVEALRVSEGKAHQNQNRHSCVGRGMEEESNTRDEIK